MRYATFIGGSWNARHELLNQPAKYIDKRRADGAIERYERFSPVGRFEGLMALRSCEQVTYVLSTMTRDQLIQLIRVQAQPLFVESSSAS